MDEDTTDPYWAYISTVSRNRERQEEWGYVPISFLSKVEDVQSPKVTPATDPRILESSAEDFDVAPAWDVPASWLETLLILDLSEEVSAWFWERFAELRSQRSMADAWNWALEEVLEPDIYSGKSKDRSSSKPESARGSAHTVAAKLHGTSTLDAESGGGHDDGPSEQSEETVVVSTYMPPNPGFGDQIQVLKSTQVRVLWRQPKEEGGHWAWVVPLDKHGTEVARGYIPLSCLPPRQSKSSVEHCRNKQVSERLRKDVTSNGAGQGELAHRLPIAQSSSVPTCANSSVADSGATRCPSKQVERKQQKSAVQYSFSQMPQNPIVESSDLRVSSHPSAIHPAAAFDSGVSMQAEPVGDFPHFSEYPLLPMDEAKSGTVKRWSRAGTAAGTKPHLEMKTKDSSLNVLPAEDGRGSKEVKIIFEKAATKKSQLDIDSHDKGKLGFKAERSSAVVRDSSQTLNKQIDRKWAISKIKDLSERFCLTPLDHDYALEVLLACSSPDEMRSEAVSMIYDNQLVKNFAAELWRKIKV
jgi:hypothetical protein